MNRKIIIIAILIISFLVPLTAQASLGIEDGVRSYLIGDFDSGAILEKYNEEEALNIASVSKLMTYLVVKDKIAENALSLEDRVTITKEIEEIGGSNFRLLEGEVVTVDELLAGLMVVSGNDAAYALALKVAGSEAEFVNMMNLKAQELGLVNSKFYNSSGLQQGDHQNTMTTEEIFIMSRHIIKEYPEVLDYSKIKILNMPRRNYTGESTIPLVGEIPGVDGLKTGYTEEAGYCLVSTMDARKSPQAGEFRLITIVMGTAGVAERRDISKYLIDYALENYSVRTIIDDKAPYMELNINSAINPKIPIYPNESYKLLTHKSKRYVFKSDIEEGIKAPLKQGQKVGTLTLSSGNQELKKVDLIVKHDVQQAGMFTRIVRSVENLFSTIATLLRK
ncbi:MAG: D-alanyl-D-alanine carboxypeptidase family protein [Tissierellia bacterium]|nr:D-alanyl-D-alanine carboxypeptidase family protein [Tissierellia bacterium]